MFSSCGDRSPVLQDSSLFRKQLALSVHSFVLRSPTWSSIRQCPEWQQKVACTQQRLAQGPSHWGRCPVVLPALCICRVEGIFAIQELDQETGLGSVRNGSLWI